MRNGSFIINWLPMPYTLVVLKDYPHNLTKCKGKGTSKISIFDFFSELGKFGMVA